MIKKIVVLSIFLCLAFSLNATATSYIYAGVFSEHREVSEAFGGYNSYMMQAASVLGDYEYNPSNPVMLDMTYGNLLSNTYQLAYYGNQFLGNDLFVYAFPPWNSTWGSAYPDPTDPIWTMLDYKFYVDDGGGNFIISEWTIPETQKLDIPYINNINPQTHFFDWNDVEEADEYLLQILPIDESGNPLFQNAFYSSGPLLDSELTLLAGLSPGEYAIWIAARQLHPEYGGFYNRSSYIFEYQVEQVPLPPPIVMLGIGLVGLAGLKRKKP